MLNLTFGKKNISTDLSSFVMGILNVTPDSFVESSRGKEEKAFELINQGAQILDVGAESTRPGFTEISTEDEIKRLIPVLKKIRDKSQVVVSVDSRKTDVFKACIPFDIDIVNDVSCTYDEEKIDLIKENDLSLVIMHGFLLNENHASSKNIVNQVYDFFQEKAAFLVSKGISPEKIILDPGIGFGKTFEENVMLIKNCEVFNTLKLPVLMALSRKRVIGEITGKEVAERLSGSIAANLISSMKGCSILRVHDVKETIDSLKVMKYLK